LTCVVALEPGLLLKNLFELAHPASSSCGKPNAKNHPRNQAYGAHFAIFIYHSPFFIFSYWYVVGVHVAH
jgi:hypothetical protein